MLPSTSTRSFAMLVFGAAFIALTLPLASYADNGALPPVVPIVPSASGNGDALELPNPLGERTTISQIVGGVLRAAFGVLGAVALCMFLYGGFLWLISGGNNEKIQKGRDTMIWAALGIAAIFASYAITNYVITAIVGTTTQ